MVGRAKGDFALQFGRHSDAERLNVKILKLLLKEPKGREIDESDSFSYNADFSAKQMRFKARVR